MALVVNTNLDSINAQRNLSMVNFELSKNLPAPEQRQTHQHRWRRRSRLVPLLTSLKPTFAACVAVNNAQDASAMLNIADGSAQHC
ncbi:MAG: hypothetical protein R2857_07495 [Vampirovibrionales bacterium]